MKLKNVILISIIFMFLCIATTGATINVTVDSKTDTYIKWSWTTGLTLTNMSIDGYQVLLADKQIDNFILSDLNANEVHSIKIYANNDTGSSTVSTDSKPKTSGDNIADFLYEYLLLIVVLVLMVIGIRIPLCSIIAFVFALMGLLAVLPQGIFLKDIIFIVCLFGSTMTGYIGWNR